MRREYGRHTPTFFINVCHWLHFSLVHDVAKHSPNLCSILLDLYQLEFVFPINCQLNEEPLSQFQALSQTFEHLKFQNDSLSINKKIAYIAGDFRSLFLERRL